MAYEYKCVAAPEKVKRRKGAKTRTDRVALAMQDVLTEQARNGWEYMRTDLVPIEERSGIFGRLHEVHRAVLVFRRGTPPAGRHAEYPPVHAMQAAQNRAIADEPSAMPVTPGKRAALAREEATIQQASEPQEEYRLSAERDASGAGHAGDPRAKAPNGLG